MNVKHFIVQSSKLNSKIYKPGGRGRGSVDVVQVVFLDAGVAVAAVLAFNAGNQPQIHRFLILPAPEDMLTGVWDPVEREKAVEAAIIRQTCVGTRHGHLGTWLHLVRCSSTRHCLGLFGKVRVGGGNVRGGELNRAGDGWNIFVWGRVVLHIELVSQHLYNSTLLF